MRMGQFPIPILPPSVIRATFDRAICDVKRAIDSAAASGPGANNAKIASPNKITQEANHYDVILHAGAAPPLGLRQEPPGADLVRVPVARFGFPAESLLGALSAPEKRWSARTIA